MEFSIDTATEQHALYLWREKIPAYWRDEPTLHLSWSGRAGFPKRGDTSATQISPWDSSLLPDLPCWCTTSLSHHSPFHLLGLVQLPNSRLHPCCTPMQTHLSRKKHSCCNTFPVENRVKWAHSGISSCYSKIGSCNQASLGVFTLGWMVEIYLAIVVWNDTLSCKDSLII